MQRLRKQLKEQLSEAMNKYKEAKAIGRIQENTATKEDISKAVESLEDSFIRKSKELNN